MNKFFIVRHGQTQWNIQGRTQGSGDSKLTDKGKNQAYKLGKKLLKFNIDYIYSSDLGRAIETSNVLSNILEKDFEYSDGLREINFGKWEGMTIEEIKNGYGDIYKIWRSEPHNALIPDAENLIQIKERVLKAVNEINKKHENSNILLVSHSIVIKVLLLSLLGSDLSNLYRIAQDNTALNVVEFREYGPVVLKLNDSTHLEEGE